MTSDGPSPTLAPLGFVEPNAALLTAPPEGQRLFKLMTVENLLCSVAGSYLHFNRVDAYRDFVGADREDGAELPGDHAANAAISFEKAPDFKLSDYYAESRRRTYACCFSLENSKHIWTNYGLDSAEGQIGLVFDFAKLRRRLNATLAHDQAALMAGDFPCRQIFSINYGMVEYVSRDGHRINAARLPNPISYVFLKDSRFREERELRISLSAIGVGHFVFDDGTKMGFPASLALGFDFRDAFADGTIVELLAGESTDSDHLAAELRRFGFVARGTAYRS